MVLPFDRDVTPECNVPFDHSGFLRRGRVVPSSVHVDFAVDHNVVVVGRPFPATNRLFVALLEIRPVDRTRREVDIPFDDLVFVALCEYGPVPNRTRLAKSPTASRSYTIDRCPSSRPPSTMC